MPYTPRKAGADDLETIVTFTLAEAAEAEDAEKHAGAVRRGVSAGLSDPSVASYWVVESEGGEVVASASVVKEWSDWHGAYYWWIQSMCVVPEHRRRGLVEMLLETIADAAREGDSIELRLYVHSGNQRAIKAYRRCGFDDAPYAIMRKSLSGK